MGFWDDIGWISVGGYHAAKDAFDSRVTGGKAEEISEIVSDLSDTELEKKVRDEVCSASGEQYNEIWKRIEIFKRDNPHLVRKHIAFSYWGHVGKERFPFTYGEYCRMLGKKRLTKSDEKMLAMYRGWVVTLLMNTYDAYSVMESTRIAFHRVCGPGKASWTMEFG